MRAVFINDLVMNFGLLIHEILNFGGIMLVKLINKSKHHSMKVFALYSGQSYTFPLFNLFSVAQI